MIVCPLIVGGGKRFFPDGVRLDLTLVEQRRFGNDVVVLTPSAADRAQVWASVTFLRRGPSWW